MERTDLSLASVDPEILQSQELSANERRRLRVSATPAATLLGQVAENLRTSLFTDDPAEWVDMWQTHSHAARLEWSGGPELAVVLSQLAAKDYEGEIEGVPGLRMRRSDSSYGEMVWLGSDQPVALHLSRV
ncbi:hypothetical protein OG394_21810 [Kribbella sp. NBC_01245]|uniref:hypothetical protein n=1 Tax=Kribbella sp. NBC_01245 TaxID=2903578 RepID=UPI002E2BAA75|nr:hypothetical protein [Kribbella sp. NBC_01245]